MIIGGKDFGSETFPIHQKHLDAVKLEIKTVKSLLDSYSYDEVYEVDEVHEVPYEVYKVYEVQNPNLHRRKIHDLKNEFASSLQKTQFVLIPVKYWLHLLKTLRYQVKKLNRLYTQRGEASGASEASEASGGEESEASGGEESRKVEQQVEKVVQQVGQQVGEKQQVDEKIVSRDDRNNLVTHAGMTIGNYKLSDTILGEGSYGRVVLAEHVTSGASVALKITKHDTKCLQQAKIECQVLDRLKEYNVPHTVRAQDSFEFMGHPCIAFELLSKSLFVKVKEAMQIGTLPQVKVVRHCALQLFIALEGLQYTGIVHTDIKPDNILLVKENKTGLRLIDFGSACSTYQNVDTYVTSRYYRAPEVVMRAPYSHPIDMWSAACTLYELFTGEYLFYVQNEDHLIIQMVDLLGVPSNKVVESGPKGSRFFEKVGDTYKLRPVPEDMRYPYTLRQRIDRCRQCIQNDANEEDLTVFIDFLTRILTWSPDARMTPTEALNHPFITSLEGHL